MGRTGIVQLHGQGVLEVDAAANRLSCLTLQCRVRIWSRSWGTLLVSKTIGWARRLKVAGRRQRADRACRSGAVALVRGPGRSDLELPGALRVRGRSPGWDRGCGAGAVGGGDLPGCDRDGGHRGARPPGRAVRGGAVGLHSAAGAGQTGRQGGRGDHAGQSQRASTCVGSAGQSRAGGFRGSSPLDEPCPGGSWWTWTPR